MRSHSRGAFLRVGAARARRGRRTPSGPAPGAACNRVVPPLALSPRAILSVWLLVPLSTPQNNKFPPSIHVVVAKQALERSGRSHGHGSVLRLLLHRLVHLRTRGPGASRQPIEEEEYNTRGSVCAIYPPPSSPQKRAWCVHSPLIRPSAPCRARPPPSLQLFMYTILNSGGEWYLGVSKEDAPAAAHACLIAAGVYGLYLVYCGLKLGKAPKAVKDDEEA
jgi:hypothetical protein